MMLKTTKGKYINLDQARTVSAKWNKDSYECDVRVQWDADSSNDYQVYNVEWEDFEKRLEPNAIVPSPPGYFQLLFWSEGKNAEECVDRWPILAWCFNADLGFHRVFTAWTYPDEQEESLAILCPDGRVVEPGCSVWPSEAEWLEDMHKKTAEAKAKAAKPDAPANGADTHP
jgi:hypothetical protein